jgi:predicted NUDIX family NTP pyrophosphohydrolase
MAKVSAGILLYRYRDRGLEVFLVHPGGPFWKNKDAGAWSLPKGEYEAGEDSLAAAKREFREETGFAAPEGEYLPLGEVKQAGGKLVTAWATEGDCRAEEIKSNTFELEWPPKSGRVQQIPEVDRAEWFALADARIKILSGQAEFLSRLAERLVGST